MHSFLRIVEQHGKHEDAEEAHHLELWRGNVTEMLKEMARRKRLTDLLVSFAPMASQRWVHLFVFLFSINVAVFVCRNVPVMCCVD